MTQVAPLEHIVSLLLEKGAVFAARGALVLCVFTVSWLMASWAQRAVVRACERTHLDATLVRFLASLVRYAVIITALVSCLGAFGVTATSFAAILGAAGIAIGLAFQGTLSNFAAGMILLMFRPFKVGDVIRAGAHLGTVKALELFSTVLVTADNRRIVLPNSSLSNQALENVTFYSTRRADVLIPFPLDANADQVLGALNDALNDATSVHADPEPEAKIQDFSGGTMNVLVSGWCDTADYLATTHTLAQLAKRVYDDARLGRLTPPKPPLGDASPP